MESVFNFKSYKKYIIEKINQSPLKGRGLKLNMAKHIGCQSAFISQVLNGNVHFSLEQSLKLNAFFFHSKDESKFFLLLVQKDRAGSVELANFFNEEMDEILNLRKKITNRINFKMQLNIEDQNIYYSSWHYAAVHMLIAIPTFKNATMISNYLKIELQKIKQIIKFLLKVGCIVKNQNGFNVSKKSMHLPYDSSFIQRHHFNLRNVAIRSIENNNPNDLHYSTFVTISNSDVSNIKEILIKAIDDCRKVIRDSKEESLHSICLDFFSL